MKFADREDLLGAAMVGPALAYVILLVGVPFVLAILLSFSSATAGSLPTLMKQAPRSHSFLCFNLLLNAWLISGGCDGDSIATFA